VGEISFYSNASSSSSLSAGPQQQQWGWGVPVLLQTAAVLLEVVGAEERRVVAEAAVEQAHQAELPALQLRARNKFTRLRCCLHGICERRQRAKIYSCSALHSCTARLQKSEKLF
jgi:hypothetical protein